MNPKHELHKAIKAAFERAQKKNDVRREYVTDEMLVEELDAWFRDQLETARVESIDEVFATNLELAKGKEEQDGGNE